MMKMLLLLVVTEVFLISTSNCYKVSNSSCTCSGVPCCCSTDYLEGDECIIIPCICYNGGNNCDQFTGICLCESDTDGKWSGDQCTDCVDDSECRDECKHCTNGDGEDACFPGVGGFIPGFPDTPCACVSPWTGVFCDECEDGRWGSACDKLCNCQNGAPPSCDQNTGVCNCVSPWGGDRCTECVEGMWGVNCNQSCDCRNGAPSACEQATGVCDCIHSWTGDQCEECVYPWTGNDCADCAARLWGNNCEKSCDCQNGAPSTCEQATGVCECIPPWTGNNCTECTEGRTGHDCDSCASGYAGDDCQPCNCPLGAECDPLDGACHCKDQEICGTTTSSPDTTRPTIKTEYPEETKKSSESCACCDCDNKVEIVVAAVGASALTIILGLLVLLIMKKTRGYSSEKKVSSNPEPNFFFQPRKNIYIINDEEKKRLGYAKTKSRGGSKLSL